MVTIGEHYTEGSTVAFDAAKTPRHIYGLMLAITIAYLLLESAFNARLVDVLSANDSRNASTEAISGLEFWGRYISSLAVGLAIGTAHISQYFGCVRPFPFNLFQHRHGGWTRRDWQKSVAIILLAMIATFFLEKSIVERRADTTAPVNLWWAHYGARISDMVGLGIGYLRNEPEAQHQIDAMGKEKAQKKGEAPPMTFADLDSADTKAFMALLPHSSQNWAQLQPRSEKDLRPLTPAEIEERIRGTIKSQLRGSSAAQSRSAILVPVRRCFEILYDQSPPFETEQPAFPMPASRCSVNAAEVRAIRADFPILGETDDGSCFHKPDGSEKPFADFISLKCIYNLAVTRSTSQAETAVAIYDQVYGDTRVATIRQAASDPSILAQLDYDRLRIELRTQFDRELTTLSDSNRGSIYDPMVNLLPPCGRLQSALLARFDIYYDYDASQRYLQGKEQEHCNRFNSILPEQPDPSATVALSKYAPSFTETLNQRLAAVGIAAVPAGSLLTRDAFWQSIIDRTVAPVENATQRILSAQFSAAAGAGDEIPSVRSISTLDEFFSNPVISRLAMARLQELSDSAFMCAGLTDQDNAIPFSGSLAVISDQWDSQFHAQATRLIESRGLSSRLSGVVKDFQPAGRCRAAGLAAYHRATMPGIALIISLIGLLFHGGKAFFYVMSLLNLPSQFRLGPSVAIVAGLALIPLTVSSKVLNQPYTTPLVDAYRSSHGAAFAQGVRWLIRAELLMYPASAYVRDQLFTPWGISFDSTVSDTEFDARSQRIKHACGKVPQIAESKEYQSLQSLLTSRSLCEIE